MTDINESLHIKSICEAHYTIKNPPIISDGNREYYGGKQSWLSEKGVSDYIVNRACGVTAAANLLCTLNRNFKRDNQCRTKAEFNALQLELLKYIRPTAAGVFCAGRLIKGLSVYLKEKRIHTRLGRLPINYSSINEIKMLLQRDEPVLILTWNTRLKDFKNHWVTVTGYREINGEVMLTVSNWGERREYSLNEYIAAFSLYKEGVYVKP